VKRWKIAIILLLCLALTGTAACQTAGGGGGEEEFSGQLVEVVRGELTVSVSGSGFIETSNEAKLFFDGGGEVEKIYVEEGDEVSEGELLALLVPTDTDVLELAIAQAEVALEQAKYSLDQAENPYTDKEISDAEEAVDNAEDWLDLTEDMLRYVQKHGSEWEVQQWQMEVYNAEVQLDVAEDTLETMLEERDEDDIAIKQMQVYAAMRALEEAQSDLETETLTAPFAGTVASVDVEEGDIIPNPTVAQITIIHLIDPARVELSVELDEIDIPGVAEEQRAIIETDALPALPLEGRVSYVAPVPTVEAGLVQYNVKIDFDIPEGSDLKVGMSATADIILSEQNDVLLVPNRAVNYDQEDGTFVQVMVGEENSEIEKRPVVTGASDGLWTEIKAGLEEGEIVLIELKPRQDSLERLGFPSQ
jgi:RND family efflux transporter MFP subunit